MESILPQKEDTAWKAFSSSLPSGHLVQFFRDDGDLSRSMSAFFNHLLKKGFGGLVIATGPHLSQIKDALQNLELNVPQLEKDERLIFLEAENTLSQFLVGNLPHEKLFQDCIGHHLEKIRRKYKNIFTYGEMVSLLWDQGNYQGTILLEQFWNSILQEEDLVLLCGYNSPGNIGTFAKTISRLQQKEKDLETEIHERHRLESAYHEMEALKEAILENSQDCIKVLDLNANIVFMNKGGLKKLGVPDFKLLEGRSWIDFWEGELRQKARQAFQTALQGENAEMTGHLTSPDQQKKSWWDVILSPVRNSQGKIIRILAVSRDITEQILIQETAKQKARQQSEEKFRLIVESIRDYAIFMLDPEGRISTWNQGAKTFKGYDDHEVIGQHFSILYPEEDKNWKPAFELHVASREGRFEDEGWRVRKDGSRFLANVVITAIFDTDKKLLGFSKVTRDMTEIKQAEMNRLKVEAQKREIFAVNNERDRLFSIFMQVPTPIAVFRGPEHLIELFNPAAREFIGGKDPTGLSYRDVLAELKDSGLYEIIDRVYKTGQPETQFSKRLEMRQADGSSKEFYFNIWYEPLKDNNGAIVGVLNLCLNVTDQIRAIQYRDEFLSIASHELKTPITNLKFQLQMFERESKKGSQEPLSSPRILDKLTMINTQIRKITGLLEDLLDMSHLHNRKMKFEFEEVDLCSLVQDLSRRFDEEAKAQGMKILVQSHCSVVGYWDRMRIEQVVANLISNAIKYGHSPDGDHETIQIYFDDFENSVHLVVQDHGMGISEVDQDRIFGRFERAVSARHYGGLGLGLFISKQIVEAHQGKIWVESTPRKGSKFVVELPKKPSLHSIQVDRR